MKKIPYLGNDGCVKYAVPLVKGTWTDRNGVFQEEVPTNCTIYLGTKRTEVYRFPPEKPREPVYTAMASFITAYAREKTIRSAQANYDRFIYADTDSLKLVGYEEPVGLVVHDTHLGAWKDENDFCMSKWIRAKTYMTTVIEKTKRDTLKDYGTALNKADSIDTVHRDNGRVYYHKTKVTCAGMPENVKEQVTYDNFCSGSTFNGKLVPRTYPGGVILEDTTFTIK